MRVPGYKSLKLAGRWLRSRFAPSGLILGYHRVADPGASAYDLGVRPANFAQHLDVIQRYCTALSLNEFVDRLYAGQLPRRSVTLTFDDGYADFLSEAQPRLEHSAIPATVFVVSGALGQAFWWDALADVVLHAQPQARELCLRVGAEKMVWILSDEAAGLAGSKQRKRLVSDIHRRLLSVASEERLCLLAQVKEWAGGWSTAPASGRSMTADEIRSLNGSLVQVGAHSVSHPLLAELSLAAQQSEIQGGKQALEVLLGRPVTSFSYPNGSVSAATRSQVQAAGYQQACGSQSDVARRASHRYELPRMWAPDSDGDAFARWLWCWLQ